jgi:MFS family permease
MTQVVAFIFLGWIFLGVLLNPMWVTSEDQWNAVLAAEGIAGIFLLGMFVTVLLRSDPCPEPRPEGNTELNHRSTWFALMLVLVYWFILARPYWQSPRFIDDDLINLKIAQSWSETQSHLFRPFNEHLLVLTRLWAFAAVQMSSESALPGVLLSGLATLFVIANILLFRLVRREFQDEHLAVMSCAFFSLTYVHHEVWWWFMAGQWLWQLNLALVVLLLLDPFHESRGRIVAATVLAALAPFQFSIGLLIGPLAFSWICFRWNRFRAWAFLPLLGALLGLVITVPLIRSGLAEDDPSKYNIKLKWFDVNLWLGLATSVRLVVDHLVLKNLGLRIGLASPVVASVVFPVLVGMVLFALASFRHLVGATPFLALILLGYGLVIPFRSWMDYPQMSNWTARYQLFPHLGLVLFGLAVFREWNQIGPPARWLQNRRSLGIVILTSLMFAYQESTHAGWQWLCGAASHE